MVGNSSQENNGEIPDSQEKTEVKDSQKESTSEKPGEKANGHEDPAGTDHQFEGTE